MANEAESSTIPDEITGNMSLVHRVLLTDPTDFPSLTMSGHPALLDTPPYEAFVNSMEKSDEGPDIAINVNAMVKGAFRDKVCESITRNQNWAEGIDLLCELHMFIRKLVPSRPDLHTILDDNEARQATKLENIKPILIKAATALQSLESPARSETTGDWVSFFSQRDCLKDEFSEETIRIVVNGILYLLFKTELCDSDKQNYFLWAVWAPALLNEGPFLEREAFVKEYGSMDSHSIAPETRDWIDSLVRKESIAEISALQSSKVLRWNLVRTGWIEEILFRSADSSSLRLPEILWRDAGRLQGVRHVTRMAAAGSALALIACQAAEEPAESLLDSEKDETSVLHRRRKVLVQAMAEHFKSPMNYEQDIGLAVAEIAKVWKPDLNMRQVESIVHRTKGVLKAEDPVIQLLDDRMRDCFRELVVKVPSEAPLIPSHLQSGTMSAKSHPLPTDKHTFISKASILFKTQGLTFYASDLSNAARLASRVIDLALKLYGDEFVDRMILEACQRELHASGN